MLHVSVWCFSSIEIAALKSRYASATYIGRGGRALQGCKTGAEGGHLADRSLPAEQQDAVGKYMVKIQVWA